MSPDSDLPEVSPGDSDYPDFHRSTRMPLDAVVRLHFEGTVAYQNGFAANVSATGMYVKHPDPPPLGTRLVFELVLGEERKPVQGAGFVAWTREKYEGPGRPAGIGIQFTEIDALSRQHIAEALFAYLETQLGDELAEDPDVAELVAASSSRAPLDLLDSIGRPSEAAAPAARTTPPHGLPAPAAPERPGSGGFRLFEESKPADAADEPLSADDLFTPVIPPDDLADLRRAAASPRKSPWPALAIGAAIVAAAFAGWWYLAGPGSIDDAPPAAGSTANRPTTASAPVPPPRPPLDARPGTETTLAEAVGAEAAVAPEPLPKDVAADAREAASPSSAASEAPDAAPANAVPAAAPATSAAFASRVVAIDWEESNGLTVVVIAADSAFPPGSFRWYEIRDANPRVLVRFRGMTSPFPGKSVMAAGTPQLRQVRTGYHQRGDGHEQHIVLDLAGGDVRVDGVEATGNRLYVRLIQQ